MSTKVRHWRYDDGTKPINPGNQFGESFLPAGWYCWVYPEDDHEFDVWMAKHCPTSDYTHRFNSGDPMFTVYIKDEKEAMLFGMKWLEHV